MHAGRYNMASCKPIVIIITFIINYVASALH